MSQMSKYFNNYWIGAIDRGGRITKSPGLMLLNLKTLGSNVQTAWCSSLLTSRNTHIDFNVEFWSSSATDRNEIPWNNLTWLNNGSYSESHLQHILLRLLQPFLIALLGKGASISPLGYFGRRYSCIWVFTLYVNSRKVIIFNSSLQYQCTVNYIGHDRWRE
jgi:hypothetical protein